MKNKVLVIGRSLSIGGVEKALVGLLNSIDYSKYDVDLLLSMKEGDLLNDINKNVNILPEQDFFNWVTLSKQGILKSFVQLSKHPIVLFKYVKNIAFGLCFRRMAEARQRMWNESIDYIPALSAKYHYALDFSGLFRLFTLKKVNANYKYTWIHSDYRVFGLNTSLDKPLLSSFDKICCVSESCKQIFDSIFPDIKYKSIVVQNIIDRQLIKKQACSTGGFTDGFNGIRLLDVTRIDPNKGLDIAVDVCAILKARGVDFRWYVLGNDPLGYRKRLERIIKERGVEQYFILLGFSSNPYPFMKQSDIIVHFSRFEGRSVAIDEAQALHKPILVTNYPTAKDQIISGFNGIISEFDVQALTDNLLQLINSRTLRERLSNNLVNNSINSSSILL